MQYNEQFFFTVKYEKRDSVKENLFTLIVFCDRFVHCMSNRLVSIQSDFPSFMDDFDAFMGAIFMIYPAYFTIYLFEK